MFEKFFVSLKGKRLGVYLVICQIDLRFVVERLGKTIKMRWGIPTNQTPEGWFDKKFLYGIDLSLSWVKCNKSRCSICLLGLGHHRKVS